MLFWGTIRDNIARGKLSGDATQEEIENAARAANAHDFISALPLGRFLVQTRTHSSNTLFRLRDNYW